MGKSLKAESNKYKVCGVNHLLREGRWLRKLVRFRRLRLDVKVCMVKGLKSESAKYKVCSNTMYISSAALKNPGSSL